MKYNISNLLKLFHHFQLKAPLGQLLKKKVNYKNLLLISSKSFQLEYLKFIKLKFKAKVIFFLSNYHSNKYFLYYFIKMNYLSKYHLSLINQKKYLKLFFLFLSKKHFF